MQKNVEYYLSLPYTVFLKRDEEGDYVARVQEIPGCSAHGKTEAEALANLKETEELWFTDCIERGDPVPEPAPEESMPSGKWVQRVPRSLHKKLSALAEQEGVSLNQLVTSMLSEAAGRKYPCAGTDESKSHQDFMTRVEQLFGHDEWEQTSTAFFEHLFVSRFAEWMQSLTTSSANTCRHLLDPSRKHMWVGHWDTNEFQREGIWNIPMAYPNDPSRMSDLVIKHFRDSTPTKLRDEEKKPEYAIEKATRHRAL